MDIINKIVSLLKQNNRTQKELTDYLGIEKSVFSTWKAGKSQSYVRYISQIADFFGISSDALTSDSISFDFVPHDLDRIAPLCCPICDSDVTTFRKTRSVHFNNEKSSGLALEFFCEEGHIFYLLIESFKGNTYSILTDDSCNDYKTFEHEFENAPESLGEMIKADFNKKYRTLDEYGKRTVDSVLDIESERCQSKQNIFTFRRLSINKASAGLGFDLNDPDLWKEIRVIDTPEARKADMAVTVEGQSMEPDYYDGDIVYISLASEIPLGQVGLFIQNNKGYIKEAGRDCIISRNPEYNDIYPSDGEIECKGLVIGKAMLAE